MRNKPNTEAVATPVSPGGRPQSGAAPVNERRVRTDRGRQDPHKIPNNPSKRTVPPMIPATIATFFCSKSSAMTIAFHLGLPSHARKLVMGWDEMRSAYPAMIESGLFHEGARS